MLLVLLVLLVWAGSSLQAVDKTAVQSIGMRSKRSAFMDGCPGGGVGVENVMGVLFYKRGVCKLDFGFGRRLR